MVKDHSYSERERGNLLPPHGLLFPISSKGSFYMHHPTYRITHITPVVGAMAGTRNNPNGSTVKFHEQVADLVTSDCVANRDDARGKSGGLTPVFGKSLMLPAARSVRYV